MSSGSLVNTAAVNADLFSTSAGPLDKSQWIILQTTRGRTIAM